ncbi:TetR/AcrR family transcriptional regulator [Leucobacter sp. CSA2]|uniref:TetR/AcrR family transcriptional regulator n=1 Tax=Leucobacter edaphi TaxID=2796472 RepID=A0A934UW88_9MICO|nr:TetR/AcrR family transcriptional regulator [Leucobacter edaphi]MBK0420695.1 TetR/AcrR family transcriptional regulator [Leucobacter edaphi]
MNAMDAEREQLLDAAERLFYDRGFQAVGMDALRTAAALPLKRVYALFPGKEAIVVAMLDRRDDRWQGSLARRIAQEPPGPERVRALFDWLHRWLADEGYRGCAWVNASGELGATSPGVAEAARRHQHRLREQIDRVAHESGIGDAAAALFYLFEGALVTAGISGNRDAALEARAAADRLLGASGALPGTPAG